MVLLTLVVLGQIETRFLDPGRSDDLGGNGDA
jgi:hypothetical protein